MADANILGETEIADVLVNTVVAQTRLTDLSQGSMLSLIMRGAIAPEIHALYLAALTVADGFYVASSGGTALRRRLADFGIGESAAVVAYGSARFTRSGGSAGDVVIPSGFALSVTDHAGEILRYSTRAESTILDGVEYVDTIIDAAEGGMIYNVGAGPMVLVSAAPANLASVATVNAITTGANADTDQTLRSKWSDWLAARARGTEAALKLAATSYSTVDSLDVTRYPVSSAATEEHIEAAGPENAAVSLYIFGQNGLPSTDVEVAAVQQRIDGYTSGGVEVEGYRPAGVKVYVTRPDTVEVDIRVDVTLSASGSSQDVELFRTRLSALVAATGIGDQLTVKSVFDEICQMGDSFANARVIEPAQDTAIIPSQKVVLGRLTVQG